MSSASPDLPMRGSPYQPYPISDFPGAMYRRKEAWISPRNAWRLIENGRVFRGRLEKRRGFSRFSELVGSIQSVPGAALPGGFPGFPIPEASVAYQASSSGILVGLSAEFSYTDGDSSVLTASADASSCVFDESIGGCRYEVRSSSGVDIGEVIQESSGDISALLVWSRHPGYGSLSPDPTPGEMTYREGNGYSVTGIVSFRDASATEFLVALDRESLYLYDSVSGYFVAESPSPVFTGSDSDLFWSWNAGDYLLLTNNVDPVYRWTPGGTPSLEPMDTQFGPGIDDVINRALLVVRLKGRLVYLNTTEGGNTYRTRARWSTPGGFESLDELDFADAPADIGSIRTADMIGESLFVGFDRGWMVLEETGDSNSPLEWRPTTSRFGCSSKLSTIRDGERLLTRSSTSIQAIDPNGQYAADADIPDFVLDFNPDSAQSTVGFRNEAARAFWWSFSTTESDSTNRVLCAQYDEENRLAWSVYKMAFTAFTTFDNQSSGVWDSLTGVPDDYVDVIVDSASVVSGFSTAIAGDSRGRIFAFDNSTRDQIPGEDDSIDFEAITQRLSPFPNQRCHLGKLEVYGSASSGAQLEIDFLADGSNAAHMTKTVDLSPNSAGEKVWRTIRVNRIATFHEIRIRSTGTSHFAIDALIPWFRPAGRVRNFR